MIESTLTLVFLDEECELYVSDYISNDGDYLYNTTIERCDKHERERTIQG